MSTNITIPEFVENQKPEDIGTTKQQFIRQSVSKTVEANQFGVTLSDLQEVLPFDRRTIGKHLFALTLTGELYYVQRGRTKVYFSNLNGVVEGTRERIELGETVYEVMKLENQYGEFVYMRKGSDGTSEGGFLVPKEDFDTYLDTLQAWR